MNGFFFSPLLIIDIKIAPCDMPRQNGLSVELNFKLWAQFPWLNYWSLTTRNAAITPPPPICSDMHHCFPKEPPPIDVLNEFFIMADHLYISWSHVLCQKWIYIFFLHEKINSAFMSQMKLLAEQFSYGHFHLQ